MEKPTADELAVRQEDGGVATTHQNLDTTGFANYGISGLQRYGAVSRVYEEFLRELQGPQGMQSYREMMNNDPIVGAILFAALHLCRKVSVQFKPANDSNEARAVADFVGSAIFDDMESSWPDTLSEILTMLPYGWAFLEFRMKRRMGMGPVVMDLPKEGNETPDGIGIIDNSFVPSMFDDGKTGFRSWSLRGQDTLYQWEFDEDSKAIVMQQMAPPDFRIRRIPLSKGFLFRTQVSKNNPEGRSVLRNAWTSYYFKKNLQVFEGIGIERDLAGYPMIQMEKPDIANGLAVPDIWNTKDPAMTALLSGVQKMVRSVRRDEQEGMVLPWWAKFSLLSTGSRRSFDTNAIIGRYAQSISQSMMADFIMLGHEAVGSKALAATKISLFTSALSSFMDTIGAIIDRQATPILLRFNGIPMKLAPRFTHGDVESVNIAELGDFIAKISGLGFNPLTGFDARKAVMQAANLPTEGMDTGPLVDPNAVDANGKPVKRPSGGGSGRDMGPGDNALGNFGPPVAAEGFNSGGPAAIVTE